MTIKDMEGKLQDIISKAVQEAITQEIQKVREEFQSEIDNLRSEIVGLEERLAEGANRDSESAKEKRTLVLFNITEGRNENVVNKVNSILKDGVKLKDITVESAERKASNREGKPGIVVALCKSEQDKWSVLKSKSKLKDSRQYSKVIIEPHKSADRRAWEASLRELARVGGLKDKLLWRGGRLVKRNNSSDTQPQSQRNGQQTIARQQGSVSSQNNRCQTSGANNRR